MDNGALKYIFNLDNKKSDFNKNLNYTISSKNKIPINLIFKSDNKTPSYWLTRFIILRFLGFVYLIAFLSLAFQVIPLIGENGLLPADNYLDSIRPNFNSNLQAFLKLPTIFWFHISDNLLFYFSWIGVLLSIILLSGYSNSILMFSLWILYMSYVHIGQLWYSFGWEIQLLETGFLAIFLVPFLNSKPFPKTPPPLLIIWLYRWLAFRIYLGAGLIKIKGSECWRNLTCMYYHYETQPIPNPLSPFFHSLPKFIHKIEVLWNHFIELIIPFTIFTPRNFRIIGGILLFTFQFILILSGNLSFLNWLTIIPGLALFDDKFLKKILPKFIVKKADKAKENSKPINKFQNYITILVFISLLWFSIPVIQNLLSDNQRMNTSFNQWNLVNTYGAFGSISKERHELVIEGTSDQIITPDTTWKEYELKAKPTSINRSLPFIAPYQPRIDWQIWFAAMSTPDRQPWLIHLVWKLLHNDPIAISLIFSNPFPDNPPNFIRIEFYKYELNKPFSEQVWNRTHLGTWLNPLSKDTIGFKEIIKANNWDVYENPISTNN